MGDREREEYGERVPSAAASQQGPGRPCTGGKSGRNTGLEAGSRTLVKAAAAERPDHSPQNQQPEAGSVRSGGHCHARRDDKTEPQPRNPLWAEKFSKVSCRD